MNWTLWRPAFLFVTALVVATVAILGVRGSTSHVPPREFDKGMWVQPKAKAQAASAFFADGRAFDQQGFVDAVAASYRWLPGLEPLLEELHAIGLPMHAFSNYPVWYRLIEERLRLSRFLDWTFVSCLIGARKPAADAYEKVLGQLDVPAERCVFIDDRRSNCEAARAQGIQAVRFEGVDALRVSLGDLSLL